MKSSIIAIFTILTFSVSKIKADLIPGFNNQVCAWNASDIVVAKLTNDATGEFEVTEMINGTQKPGTKISLPFIKNIHQAYETKDNRRAQFSGGLADSINSERVILFLRKNNQNQWAPGSLDTSMEKNYTGIDDDALYASFMKISMAWIIKNKVYGFSQNMNPGPLELNAQIQFYSHNPNQNLYFTETAFKSYIENNLQLKTRLLAIEKIENSKIKADSIIPFFHSPQILNHATAMDLLLKTLANCGMDAYTGIKPMLDTINPVFASENRLASFLLWRFAQVGGSKTEPILNLMLKNESLFWQSKPDFATKLIEKTKADILFYTLYGLAAQPYTGCKDCKLTVSEVYTFFKQNPSLPMQADIIKTCRQILDKP